MVFSGLPQQGWRDWLYGSIEELADPTKALWRWLQQQRFELGSFSGGSP
jgi:hypothetical protein